MRFLYLFLCITLANCQNEQVKGFRATLQMSHAFGLREMPDEKSPEIMLLSPGAKLEDLHEVSPHSTSIYLRDSLHTDPWLYVRTSDGKTGWIFAAAAGPVNATAAQQRQWALRKRLCSITGPEACREWSNWLDAPQPDTDSAFARYVHTGLHLRDSLNLLIARRVIRGAPPESGDLFWLAELSPYFVVQRIAREGRFQLFLDFRQVARTAAATRGDQDDLFAQTGYLAFPADSIESNFPSWVFPLDSEGNCSNLGEGHHLTVLQSIDLSLRNGRQFEPELLKMKDRILDDVLRKDGLYWQPEEKIITELKNILSKNLGCLSEADKIMLRARFKMFQDAGASGLQLNLRSGEPLHPKHLRNSM